MLRIELPEQNATTLNVLVLEMQILSDSSYGIASIVLAVKVVCNITMLLFDFV